ncbi:MAG: penicillin-binding transpeptidase domain-containing protein [Mariprofundaceae bacterium]|nr:penicillin-binding transpeptidase domain-containing protein [Mariprofundaceae bacterium]
MSKADVFFRRRIEALTACIVLGLLLLMVRVVDLQWLQAENLQNLADKQRERQYTVSAPRGPVLDVNGRMLAESIQVPSIAAIGRDVPEDRIAELAKALGIPEARLASRLKRKGFVWLARQIDPAKARAVEVLDIPGVRQETEWRRFNPLGPATGHLLGFVGMDGHGLEGLEHSMDAQLTGQEGRKHVQRDARGHYLPGANWLLEPKMGGEVSLYLDATLQSMAYAALAEGVHKQGAKGGSVVVMRPADGAVLAMASWPGFNPNNYRRFHPRQWRNRAITDVFEPGSVLKPFAVAAALQTDRWKRDSVIFCENGSYRVADYVIHDVHPEGWLDMTGLLARSSNICAAKVALDIGPQKLFDMLEAVGLGRRGGIGLSGESPGIMTPLERWGPVETATIAFGQGIAITPLQLATAFSVLANGGTHVSPKLIQGHDAEPSYRVMPEPVARAVMRMLMHAASLEGTGAKAVPAGYRVAGKTGTAQKPGPRGGYAKDKYAAVFAGAVPAENPELVIAVMIDEPKKSIYGGTVAAPVFRRIAAAALPYLGVPPEQHPQWSAMQASLDVVSPVTGDGLPSLYGNSLREVRRLAMQEGYQLRVHGSGWVVRQKPVALSRLEASGLLEVWLDE